ncbi:MAG: LytTR family DNA-binding domain-containing protein [Thiohalobacterales bacterium]|nr:LytTR family DNA-binding domain-containing protein [Thiohalobacterales bacterium]
MKVLIVDDEAPARMRLKDMLEGTGDYEVCGLAANGGEAVEQASAHDPDVVLMDIRMPGMDGLEAARHLQAMEHPPAVIFTTAYNDYALQAFDTHAVDYLLKPVRQARLAEALRHARRMSRVQIDALELADEDHGARDRICARVRGSLQLIPVADIRYFQADQKYVTVCTADECVLIEETLKSLEDEFADRFVRIHRNALVARRYITGMVKDGEGRAHVQLAGVETTLEVSRRHMSQVRKLVRALEKG